MNFNTYRRLAARTEKPLPTVQERTQHAIMGIVSECGELVGRLKKIYIYKDGGADREDRDNLHEELGDICWYIAILANLTDADLTEKALHLKHVYKIALANQSHPTDRVLLPLSLKTAYALIYLGLRFEHTDRDDAVNGTPSDDFVASLLALLSLLSNSVGFEDNSWMEDNITKLKQRHPDKYTDSGALARADKPAGE